MKIYYYVDKSSLETLSKLIKGEGVEEGTTIRVSSEPFKNSIFTSIDYGDYVLLKDHDILEELITDL
jgi:hypothetical protein